MKVTGYELFMVEPRWLFLKIDTEGHDCVILNNYIDHCKTNKDLLAKKILFETNMNNKARYTWNIFFYIDGQ
jgi:hypothetical protein